MILRSFSPTLKLEAANHFRHVRSSDVRGPFTPGVRNVPPLALRDPSYLRHFKKAVRWVSMSTRYLHGTASTSSSPYTWSFWLIGSRLR